MTNQKKADGSESAAPSGAAGGSLESRAAEALPIIASARTGLASKDDAIMRRLPADYNGTVGDMIKYITTTDVTTEESDLAESVKREVAGRQSVVMVNGKKVTDLNDPVSKYAIVATRGEGPKAMKYTSLEVEVSSVQQGGRPYTLMQ